MQDGIDKFIEELNKGGVRKYLRHSRTGDQKAMCPQCHGGRGKESSLSVTIGPGTTTAGVALDAGEVMVHCHRASCGYSTMFKNDGHQDNRDHERAYRAPKKQPPKRPKKDVKPDALPDDVYSWFGGRGIGAKTLKRSGVGYGQAWMPGDDNGQTSNTIQFPYRRKGELVNIKYRTGDKRFKQEKGAEKVFFGLDTQDVDAPKPIVIVEGEMDVLSLMEIGADEDYALFSVPDGAPKQVRDDDIDPENDAKFEYVWNCRAELDAAPKIIIAVDADEPGEALEEELARRIGKERVWLVRWPTINELECKDANEMLLAHGPEALRECIDGAEPYPIQSLHEAASFESQTFALYREGRKRGLTTGWKCIDPLFTVRPGELTVVTGYPGSGKSEFIDALMCNVANIHGWTFGVCSFENPADEHISKFAEKYVGAPFYDGPRNRMTEAELHGAMDWINSHFLFIRADEESPTIDWLLDKAKAAVVRYGIRGLVIDPYNELEHKRPGGMTETEYVSQMLAKVKRFAQNHGVHVWFIAHPAKPQKDREADPPTLYDISGSANWVNKADIGVVVHRGFMPDGTRKHDAEIHVRKVRFKAVGQPGMSTLDYDFLTGRYTDPNASDGQDGDGQWYQT